MKKMKLNNKQKYGIPIALSLAVILIGCVLFFFSGLSKQTDTTFLYIDGDDSIDSVYTKLETVANRRALTGFKTLARHSAYGDNIRTGRYALEPGECAVTVFRKLKNGMQTPVNLTIPSVRTMERLAAELGKKLMVDSTELIEALTDEQVCERYGCDTATIACLFIPNTYGIYWNTTIEKFLDRMKTESDAFWNDERRGKAKKLNLTEEEVITLASIVDEETANNQEKPMIAGMYYNRLKEQMPLQADPTVKFALKQFELRRIYHNMLSTDSPYNTYRYEGLPPGPIRIPTIAGIDAVLNMVHHDYLYMCAKEDFSGTHNFARTYNEHLQNAAKYSKALNERGIQ